MRVICVDRSPWGLMEMKKTVKRLMPNAEIRGCRDRESALMQARETGCDILLTEIDLGGPKWEGLDLAAEVQRLRPRVNIIFVTDFPEREYAETIIRLRISGYVRKPYGKEELEREFPHLRYA